MATFKALQESAFNAIINSLELLKTSVETSESNAQTSENNASTSESNALTSANNASTSATNASEDADDAEKQAQNTTSFTDSNSVAFDKGAKGYSQDASTFADNASSSASNASTSESNALTSEQNASTSESNALSYRNKAEQWAEELEDVEVELGKYSSKHYSIKASDSAISASNSASTATTKANEASTSASNALTSENNASTSESNALTYKNDAETAKNLAETAYDNFDDRYLGSKTSDPTLDNDGGALVEGAIYWNSTDKELKAYDGANWQAQSTITGIKTDDVELVATAGQTTFNVTYTVGQIWVLVNGAKLKESDYTATNGTSVVLDTAVSAGDVVTVVKFDANEINSENVLFVRANGTPVENGTELKSAYATAKTMTPNSSAISATNRVVILCNAGVYEFASESVIPVLDTDYIDIISITGEKDLNFTLTTGTWESKIIDISANCIVVGVYSTSHRFVVQGGLSNLYLKNCQGKFGSFGYGGYATTTSIQGRFENCIGGNYSFGSYTQGFEADCVNCTAGTNSFGRSPTVSGYVVSGTLRNCTAGENSFGYKMLASGTFIDCESTGNYSFGCGEGATGTFIRCKVPAAGFGRALVNAVDGTVCSGTFIDCNAGGGFSFGYYATISGEFRNCTGGSRCYGYGVEANGTFINCTGGSDSFGSGTGGIASGYFEGCDTYQDGFGGAGGSFTGTLLYCRINNASNPNFPTPSSGGKIINSFDGNGNIISVNSVPSGGESGQALVKTSNDDYDVEWSSSIAENVNSMNDVDESIPLESLSLEDTVLFKDSGTYKPITYNNLLNQLNLDNWFTMLIKTDNAGTSTNTQFTIPTNGAGYDYTVLWGDGSSDTGVTGDITHTYATAGTYTVRIRGDFPTIYFNGGGDKDKLLKIERWGDIEWQSFYVSFFVCTNLTSASSTSINTSNVTNMMGMFSGCNSLTTLDVSGWNTSSVTNMRYMFYNCTSLTTLDVSLWNTSSVTNMGNMFRGCNSLTTLDVSGWNTSSVTNMRDMFRDCTSLTTLDVSGFNTSQVTSMREMFRDCTSLTNFDPSGFTITNVTSLSSFANGTNMGTTNYDNLLVNWEAQLVNNSLSPNFGNAQYTAGSADSGTTSATTANKLVDSTQNFLTTVSVGDAVKNTTDGTWSYVTAVDSDTQLTLNSDIMVSGELYEIYSNASAIGKAKLIDDHLWSIADGGSI